MYISTNIIYINILHDLLDKIHLFALHFSHQNVLAEEKHQHMTKLTFYIVMLTLCSFRAAGQSDVYLFPVTKASTEWKNLVSYPQKRTACQLPNTTLKSISTLGLLETCLDYPLLTDLLMYNDLQTGVDKLSSNFNGISELLNRSDIAQVLILKYKSLAASRIKLNQTSIEKGRQVFIMIVIESLIAQYNVINSLKKEQKKELVSITYNSFLQKKLDIEFHSSLGLTSTAWIVCRALNSDSYQPTIEKINKSSIMNNFAKKGIQMNFDDTESIIKDANQYLQL